MKNFRIKVKYIKDFLLKQNYIWDGLAEVGMSNGEDVEYEVTDKNLYEEMSDKDFSYLRVDFFEIINGDKNGSNKDYISLHIRIKDINSNKIFWRDIDITPVNFYLGEKDLSNTWIDYLKQIRNIEYREYLKSKVNESKIDKQNNLAL